jgi:hypothetical protein
MIYFNEGDIVAVRHLTERPLMVVKRTEKMMKPNEEGKSILIGIKCYWFDKNDSYQEATFNSKDLEMIKSNKTEKMALIDKDTVKVRKIREIENM